MAGELFGKKAQRLAARLAPLRLLLQSLEALVLLLFLALAALLPPKRASSFGAALAGWIGPRLAKHRHVNRNLAFALPEGTSGEREAAARGSWRTLGAVLAEMPHLGRLADLERRPPAVELCTAEGAEDIPDRLAEGEAFVFVTAHLGNWELLPRLLVQLGGKAAVIYTPQGNPLTDSLLQWLRRSPGIAFVGKQGGVRALLQAMRRGESLGLLVDLRSDEGEAIPFFDVPAMTSTAPARLALMAKAELIPVRVERLAPARFRVTVDRPIQPRDPAASAQVRAREMTEQINARFAAWIRLRPADWLCTKRRFPKDIPLPEAPDRGA
ncbi:lysophospholipid acyltransferase family protein [Aquibaculum sediminis]|uniref:lysophospholipid acyltransferase family protein n=1 Tax=Aquibaculum sediminis TaxID=3231907 RepID=UPI0034569905